MPTSIAKCRRCATPPGRHEANPERRLVLFCPQCKGEYRPGFVRCADCDIQLVAELPSEIAKRGSASNSVLVPVLVTANTSLLAAVTSVLNTAGIRNVEERPAPPGKGVPIRLLVPQGRFEEATILLEAELSTDLDSEGLSRESVGTYEWPVARSEMGERPAFSLLSNESVLVQLAGGALTLTTHRVRYNTPSLGRGEITSIMLEEV